MALFALRTLAISTLGALLVHLFGQSQKERSQKSALLRSNASYECPWLRSRSSQNPSDVPPPTLQLLEYFGRM